MWKFSFQDQGVLKIAKNALSIVMLNISAIKELLHKPSKIHWNTTGILSGKLKRKIWGGGSVILQDITAWNHKIVI